MNADVQYRWPALADGATIGPATVHAYQDSAIVFLEPDADYSSSAHLTPHELRRLGAACLVLAHRLSTRPETPDKPKP